MPAELRRAFDALAENRLLDGVGGELGFDRSRLALCASTAYVALGDGERAEPAAKAAQDMFASLDDVRRWNSGAVAAAVDLGTARVLRGNLAGAEDALSEVFAIPPAERTEAVSQRLLGLGRILGSNRYRGAVEATRVGEAIEAFTAASLPRTTAQRAIGP